MPSDPKQPLLEHVHSPTFQTAGEIQDLNVLEPAHDGYKGSNAEAAEETQESGDVKSDDWPRWVSGVDRPTLYVDVTGTYMRLTSSTHRRVSISSEQKAFLDRVFLLYTVLFFLVIFVRGNYHLHQKTNQGGGYLAVCTTLYVLLLCLQVVCFWSCWILNLHPWLFKHLLRSPQVRLTFVFCIIYVIQVAVLKYNPLLDDDTPLVFKVATALVEVCMIWHGIFLDAVHYVPYFIKFILLFTNFVVVAAGMVHMYLTSADRPMAIPPEFRYIDLYTGALNAILVMYVQMLWRFFAYPDGLKASLIERYMIIRVDETSADSNALLGMWVPILVLVAYIVIGIQDSHILWRTITIVLYPLLLWFCVLRNNIRWNLIFEVFKSLDVCWMAVVPIIHVFTGFYHPSEATAGWDHLFSALNIYVWLLCDLLKEKSDSWVLCVTVSALAYAVFEILCTTVFWDSHEEVVIFTMFGHQVVKGHTTRGIFTGFVILGVRGLACGVVNFWRDKNYMLFVRTRVEKPIVSFT